MSKSSSYVHSIVASLNRGPWFPISCDHSRAVAVNTVRSWVYAACAYSYSHPDTACVEHQPWWVMRAAGWKEKPPVSTGDFLCLEPWIAAVIRYGTDLDDQSRDVNRIVEVWAVGPYLYADDEYAMHGWCGLKLRPESHVFPRSWHEMLDAKYGVVSTRRALQSNVNNLDVLKTIRPQWELLPYDFSFGANRARTV